MSVRLPWQKAADECFKMNSDAFLVAINNQQEQEAVEAISSHLGNSKNHVNLTTTIIIITIITIFIY